MKLAEPSDVLLALGIASGTGALSNAAAALDLTAPIIEAMLDAPLDQQTIIDYFDYDDTFYQGATSFPTFRLSSGFIDREETFTIGGEGVSGYTDLSYWSIDYTRGLLTPKFKPLAGVDAVTVEYTRGFAETGTNKVLSGLPEWLKQAGILAACHYLQITPANVVNKQNVSMKDVTEPLRVMLSRVIYPKARPRLSLEFAARSEKVE